jgi:hypothetical protein
MGTLDRLAKRSPQGLGVIPWKSPQQLVQRIHGALATGFTRFPRPKLPVAKFCCGVRSTNSPHKNDVDSVGQKNDFAPLRQKSFLKRGRFMVNGAAGATHRPSETAILLGLWHKKGGVASRFRLARSGVAHVGTVTSVRARAGRGHVQAARRRARRPASLRGIEWDGAA